MKATSQAPEIANGNSSGEARFQPFNPEKGENISSWFSITTPERLDQIVTASFNAFGIFQRTTGLQRAALLERIGEEILNLGDALIHKCVEETGLTEGRIVGERARTINQLKLFADLLREGSWVNARIDTALPDRKPAPRPDIRQMQKPIGPVAVFEASNFPLAFATAGGDTASALAAGCTVVAKSHSNHPGTSELVATAIHRAIAETGMPKDVFSLIHGPGKQTGAALVSHPLIKAVGFTGSFSGGKALYDLATRREEPIPVFAEMGSVNPVFVLPNAILTRSDEIATALAQSIVLGAGQFCTNPGMIVVEDSFESRAFIKSLADKLAATPASTMLSQQIQQAFRNGVKEFLQIPGVIKVAEGRDSKLPCQGIPHLIETNFSTFINNSKLSSEVFGPASLVVVTSTRSEVNELARGLSGHLTATLHGTSADFLEYRELVEILESKVGRIIANGVPTGVEVSHAMVHGGPYPATTDAKFTSVGSTAIYRFTRPVCYQDFPDSLLPDELRDNNPLALLRLVDGVYKRTN